MLAFSLNQVKRILCVGAHSDDIEIGCGGTLLKLIRDNKDVHVHWVVFSAGPVRSREARQSARLFLEGASRKKVVVKDFETSFFPFQGERIKRAFEQLKSFRPDVVFTHYRDDRHQDHRLLSDLAWNTFRNHLILEYEIPKYDGDLGLPNLFVPLDDVLCRQKVANIGQVFRTQRDKHWFRPETFLALMRLRGVECASDTSYAEGFHCRKIVAG